MSNQRHRRPGCFLTLLPLGGLFLASLVLL